MVDDVEARHQVPRRGTPVGDRGGLDDDRRRLWQLPGGLGFGRVDIDDLAERCIARHPPHFPESAHWLAPIRHRWFPTSLPATKLANDPGNSSGLPVGV